ncbi:MAG: nucleotidyltransferase family protein [Candidatus Sericytochromatia bacterium]|nr:nucleotidyltransferase family protein [Candidatus Sericytochromatia bacterium]
MAAIQVNQEQLARFCLHWHICSLSLFGSVLRDDFREDSDVDVLVEFEPEHIPGFFALARMEMELSPLFEGRKVDLRTPADLSRYFQAEVMQQAEIQYAQG